MNKIHISIKYILFFIILVLFSIIYIPKMKNSLMINWSIFLMDDVHYIYSKNTHSLSNGVGTNKEEFNSQLVAEEEDNIEKSFFITTWKTDNRGVTNKNQIKIPTNPRYKYNYSIDWGDGTKNIKVKGDITHTYINSGIYTIRIYGEFPAIYFKTNSRDIDALNSDSEKLLYVNQWGKIKWKSMYGAFARCKNLKFRTDDKPDLSRVRDMGYMFYKATMFNSPIGSWDVSKVVNMKKMFYEATFFNQNLEEWDVSNVVNMDYMFFYASSFSDNDLSKWDVENVKTHINFSLGWGEGNIEPIWK